MWLYGPFFELTYHKLISAYKDGRLKFSFIRVRWQLLGAFLTFLHPSEGHRKSFNTQTNIKTCFCTSPDCLTLRQFTAKIPKYRPSSYTVGELESRWKFPERVARNRETVCDLAIGNFGKYGIRENHFLHDFFSTVTVQLNSTSAELYWSPKSSQDSGGCIKSLFPSSRETSLSANLVQI